MKALKSEDWTAPASTGKPDAKARDTLGSPAESQATAVRKSLELGPVVLRSRRGGLRGRLAEQGSTSRWHTAGPRFTHCSKLISFKSPCHPVVQGLERNKIPIERRRAIKITGGLLAYSTSGLGYSRAVYHRKSASLRPWKQRPFRVWTWSCVSPPRQELPFPQRGLRLQAW